MSNKFNHNTKHNSVSPILRVGLQIILFSHFFSSFVFADMKIDKAINTLKNAKKVLNISNGIDCKKFKFTKFIEDKTIPIEMKPNCKNIISIDGHNCFYTAIDTSKLSGVYHFNIISLENLTVRGFGYYPISIFFPKVIFLNDAGLPIKPELKIVFQARPYVEDAFLTTTITTSYSLEWEILVDFKEQLINTVLILNDYNLVNKQLNASYKFFDNFYLPIAPYGKVKIRIYKDQIQGDRTIKKPFTRSYTRQYEYDDAILETYPSQLKNLYLNLINNEFVPYYLLNGDIYNSERENDFISLAPGINIISCFYMKHLSYKTFESSEKDQFLVFNVDPGKKYYIDGKVHSDDNKWEVWIVDGQGKKVPLIACFFATRFQKKLLDEYNVTESVLKVSKMPFKTTRRFFPDEFITLKNDSDPLLNTFLKADNYLYRNEIKETSETETKNSKP